MSFKDLKKQSKLGSLTAKLVKEVEKMNNTGGNTDDRIWKLDVDKSGNGYAVIRFLPAPEGEDLPFVKLYSHAFQGPGGWFIENSLTTLGQKDPVSEYNSLLWNNGTDAGKETARKQKRKLTYVSNIYVVKDPANPENEGKVFLYKYGKKIFDKLTAAMQPEFEDEEAIDPFDFWQGANFKLKQRMLQDTETMTVLNLQHQVLYLTMMMQWNHSGRNNSLSLRLLHQTSSRHMMS